MTQPEIVVFGFMQSPAEKRQKPEPQPQVSRDASQPGFGLKKQHKTMIP
jgi:hypothetical protein